MGGGPRPVTDSWEHMWWDNLHWKRWKARAAAGGARRVRPAASPARCLEPLAARARAWRWAHVHRARPAPPPRRSRARGRRSPRTCTGSEARARARARAAGGGGGGGGGGGTGVACHTPPRATAGARMHWQQQQQQQQQAAGAPPAARAAAARAARLRHALWRRTCVSAARTHAAAHPPPYPRARRTSRAPARPCPLPMYRQPLTGNNAYWTPIRRNPAQKGAGTARVTFCAVGLTGMGVGLCAAWRVEAGEGAGTRRLCRMRADKGRAEQTERAALAVWAAKRGRTRDARQGQRRLRSSAGGAGACSRVSTCAAGVPAAAPPSACACGQRRGRRPGGAGCAASAPARRNKEVPFSQGVGGLQNRVVGQGPSTLCTRGGHRACREQCCFECVRPGHHRHSIIIQTRALPIHPAGPPGGSAHARYVRAEPHGGGGGGGRRPRKCGRGPHRAPRVISRGA